MTKVYGNVEQDKIYNIVALKNLKNIKVPAICVQIDRKEKKNSNNLAHGQEDHTTTVLPLSTLTTCRNYPSGCTMLECRLDDFNRPVAQILQVSGRDSNVNNQKMGVCVEAKQMPTGPCSRVTSCPIEETCKRNNNNNRSFKTCNVETGKICNRNNNKNNNNNCNNGSPVSKVYCCTGPIFEKIQNVSNNNNNNNQKACSRSNQVKLICVPTEEEEEDEGEQLEIEERENCEEEEQREEVECPNIIMCQTETLENLLKSGKVLICQPMPPLCESTNNTVNDTIEKLPLECCTRRNGLDSTKSRSIYCPCPDRSAKKQENYISSTRCSKPMDKSFLNKPRNCTTKIDEYKRDIDVGPKLVECSTFRNKCFKEELSPLSCCSQDSLDCYKDYVSANQFEKYRACRSKRNGLQDECFLPLPYNIKCKIKEQCYKNRMEQCQQSI
ncbi:myb-like protein D isoform X2 [Vespula squamosa]|uniref:Myb-like protein D isoform X2 n=1 Tax=Vespula squamosa TaxID=30214 RepID=A0ABD2A4B2_VESSQ